MNKIEELKKALAEATPGEWETERSTRTDIHILASGRWIASVSNHEFHPTESENSRTQTNAHLIALMKNTLPDLLEAVGALNNLILCPAFNGAVFEKDKESHVAWTLARAALIKLRGEHHE